MQEARPPGVVLAGGLSRRMGGEDKGLLALGNKSLIGHVITRLAPQVPQIAINANGDVRRFAAFDLPLLPDPLPEFPGPLAGVLAAMEWAHHLGASMVVTVAADTPFFPTDLVDRLARAQTQSGICLAATGPPSAPDWHPTFGLWPVGLRNQLRFDLLAGQRQMISWALKNQAAAAFFEHATDPFFNVNTPEDLIAARRRHEV